MEETLYTRKLKATPKRYSTCYGLMPPDSTQIACALNQVFQTGFISNFGQFNNKLENRLKDLIKVEHVITTSNASTALNILMLLLPKQSEVIVTSFTFPATVHAIIHAGLKPQFTDVDKNTYNICIRDIHRKLNKNTSAIIATNNFGNPCQIEELEEIAKRNQVKLFFDSATALGSKYHDQFIGRFGDAEVFSMSGNKIITAGEGGFITTNDKELANKVKCYRNYGYALDKSDCSYVGHNGKLSEINAVLALWGLENLKKEIQARTKLVKIYHRQLTSIPGIGFQFTPEFNSTNYSFFPIAINPFEFGMTAINLSEYLLQYGIETKRYFTPPVHKTKAYEAYNDLTLGNTESLSQALICLPLHSKLKENHVVEICEIIEYLHKKTLTPSQYKKNVIKRINKNNYSDKILQT